MRDAEVSVLTAGDIHEVGVLLSISYFIPAKKRHAAASSDKRRYVSMHFSLHKIDAEDPLREGIFIK